MQNVYYYVKDVQKLTGVSQATAYKIIRDLNGELAAQGYITVSGRVPKRYFREKFYVEPEDYEALGEVNNGA